MKTLNEASFKYNSEIQKVKKVKRKQTLWTPLKDSSPYRAQQLL